MRCALILLSTLAFITSGVAAPRVDIEEGGIKDREVLELRDPAVAPTREISRTTEQDSKPITTDGRSLDQAQCDAIRVRSRRSDGKPTISRMDFCH